MTESETLKLQPGLYKLHWDSGVGEPPSLASVGRYYDGSVWMAPANWAEHPGDRSYQYWAQVARAEPVMLCGDENHPPTEQNLPDICSAKQEGTTLTITLPAQTVKKVVLEF